MKTILNKCTCHIRIIEIAELAICMEIENVKAKVRSIRIVSSRKRD